MSKTKLLEDVQDFIECDQVYIECTDAAGNESLLAVHSVRYDEAGDLILSVLKE